ncbi:FAD/NAD-binding domain-containing protein [Fomitiporia mediterranea MF3/22]|uniref:FAD/NAD-binding domain-containing protein n=1 Tax=Fomitiporia mediterranea (strain MF3/22) TaxID=694068 RepID=UPI0004407A90|nr:FAD/NAD-binding domain-containing protein [Fomitiporia mediterranea MF3/22]EJC99584.1 FAD/NAD-binding domain-containing protein [Fomitiporia mediterranea MF3/22]
MTLTVQAEPVLPTLDRLKATIPQEVSASDVASAWLVKFGEVLRSSKPEAINLDNIFFVDAFWKDILALTWDFRTIRGIDAIQALIRSRALPCKLSVSSISSDAYRKPILAQPFPDLAWIQFGFDIETKDGTGQCYVRLIPSAGGQWKAYTVFTSLETLHGSNGQAKTRWKEKRAFSTEFMNENPTVLIIGAGHSGLELAARLGTMDISTLIVDKLSRVGDNWRRRYDTLCLHDPIWYDQMPFMQFPPSWPVYSPKDKIAGWLEAYATSLELNVWMLSTVQKATWDENGKVWNVAIAREDGPVRFLQCKFLVFANGFGGGNPYIPDIPGQDLFEGVIEHSARFRSAKSFVGKKAIVVGACNSGHDIAQDFFNNGVDVTMVQRSSTYVISAGAVRQMLTAYSDDGPPLDIADRLGASLPPPVSNLVSRRGVAHIANTIDKEILERLRKAGFRLNMGPDDCGAFLSFFKRGGGYYLDVGASALIADGKIKLKAGTEIQQFTRNGIKFADGSELKADVVIFATGYGDQRDIAKDICGPDVVKALSPVWGINEEGELRSVWRDSGHPQLHFVAGMK